MVTELTTEQADAYFAEIGLERMTPDRVRALFDELGVKPQQGSYDNYDQTACCIIGALAYKYTGGRDGGFNGREIFKVTGMPNRYQEGLIDGWDGRQGESAAHIAFLTRVGTAEGIALYRAGYADGRNGWIALQT